jgi:endonuclease/exonuclease/phosphatase family metal-dependent hydrolase
MSSIEESQQRDKHDHNPRAQQLQCQSYRTRLTWKGRKSEWKLHEARVRATSGGANGNTITIMSLNRWFEGNPATAPQERLKALLSELATISADVVNLQEVTQSAIRAFQSDTRFQQKWIVSSFDAGVYSREGHGLLTLVNRGSAELVNSSRYSFDEHPDEQMRSGRTLLVLEVVKAGVHVCIINAHLESARLPKDTSTEAYREARARLVACREYQILVASKIAEGFSTSDGLGRVIFAGDMNLGDVSEEDAPERHGFQDAWRVLYGSSGQLGNTFGVNWSSDRKATPRRLDRVVYTGELRPIRFEILFTTPLPLASDLREILGHDIFLSDHAGVLAEFELFV